METPKRYSYTFLLDGIRYAKMLREDAEEFGKFTNISEISGAGPAEAFSIEGTREDIEEFHKEYDLGDRGIWFEECDLEEIK